MAPRLDGTRHRMAVASPAHTHGGFLRDRASTFFGILPPPRLTTCMAFIGCLRAWCVWRGLADPTNCRGWHRQPG